MAQINLLKQKKNPIDVWQVASAVGVKLLAVVLLLLIAYYGYLFFQGRSRSSQISDLELKMQKDRQALSAIGNRDELFTRQQQLKLLDDLLKSHNYWSGLLPVLSNVTLKTATYANIRAVNDGTITFSVNVPDMGELDKFLQVFDQPQYYKNFSDLRIGGISKTQIGSALNLQVSVHMKYNPTLLQYKQASK